jgi:hypothetical protein
MLVPLTSAYLSHHETFRPISRFLINGERAWRVLRVRLDKYANRRGSAGV